MVKKGRNLAIKWFKHISDSLDDPFISGLIRKCGPVGYLVFFGVLEIYAREFKVELSWKLTVTHAYLRQKLQRSQITLVKKSLKYIQNSGKWEIEFKENEVIIFIPKFKELMSEGTLKKIRENHKKTWPLSGQTPERNRIKEVEVEVEAEEESTYCAKTDFSSFDFFELFWITFDDKRGKVTAIKSWQEIPKLTEKLCYEIIAGAKQYANERETILAKGGTPKMAEGWLADKRWKDEIKTWQEKIIEKHKKGES